MCHGSGYEGVTATWLPHSEFGDPHCPGFLAGVIRGDRVYIECNDCDDVIRTLPAADLQRTFDEMELTLDVATEMCPHCNAVNVFTGFSKMFGFTCKQCGKAVMISQ